MVEIAPARGMCKELRQKLCDCASKLAKAAQYRNAGTVEFLIKGDLSDPNAYFIFLEMNPRIQVEHTITEEVCGVDLVRSQLLIAGGSTLSQLNLQQSAIVCKGWAMQLRITLMPGKESVISEYAIPKTPGIRVDSGVEQGRTPSSQYDPMIAKLIVSVPEGASFDELIAKALQALDDFKLVGVRINADILRNILTHPKFVGNQIKTSFMNVHQKELFAARNSKKTKSKSKTKKAPTLQTISIDAPFPGMLADVRVSAGDSCEAGQVLVVLSAMKMMNEITSPVSGKVVKVTAAKNVQVNEGEPLVVVEGYAPEDEEDDGDEHAHAEPKFSTPEGGGVSTRFTASWFRDPSTPYGVAPSVTRIRSKVDKKSEQFQKRVKHNEAMLQELHKRLETVAQGGGEKYVKVHRERGKMLPRERIAKIIDPGTKFLELSALAAWGMYGGNIHSAGMVTGIGIVHGVECMFLANDATVKGGVFFNETSKKQLRAQAIAEINHLPCIYLVDGGGANLGAGKGNAMMGTAAVFVMGGLQFKNQAVMSSKKIPQISAVLGKCTAGGAYIPAMSDETVIVKNNGTIYLGGPPLVKAATGEDADEQDLGGAGMHTSKSGVADHLAETEEDALKKVRAIIENVARPLRHQLPMAQPEPPAYDPEELLGIIPEDTKFPFDVREVIARIVDGSRFHEFKPRYGATLVCGFAHIQGYPIGIIGNNGMLFSESAIKGSHFIQLCGQRKVPLAFLHNITGFMVGTQYEHGGITKDGAKMIMAVSCVQVPKFSIVLAGSHGAGNYAMCGPAFDPRFTFLWPNAKISVMGGKQAAEVITIVKDAQNKRNGKPPLTAEQKAFMQKPIVALFEKTSSAYDSTSEAAIFVHATFRYVYDDGIIDPRDTRDVLAQCISVSLNAPYPPSTYGVFRM